MALVALALSNLLLASLLAVPAALAGLWGRRPAVTHALWLLVLLKLLTPPLFECPIAWPEAVEPIVMNPAPPELDEPIAQAEVPAIADAEPVQAEPAPKAAEIAAPPPPEFQRIARPAPAPAPALPIAAEVQEPGIVDLLLLVWLAGSLGWLTLALVRIWRFQRLLRFAQPAPAQVFDMARESAHALGVRCPRIEVLPGRISPLLWTLGRSPRLLIPAALVDRLTPDQMATLLAHELAHWRRRDDRIRWVELAVLTVYWWCPLAWWARRALHHAEEECCDAWVVALLPESAKAYALTLVETLDFLSGAPAPLPVAASGLGRVRFLKRRLTMILQGKTPRALTFTGLVGVAGVGVLLLPLVFSRPQETQIAAQQPGLQPAPTLEQLRIEIVRMKEELDRLQTDQQKRQLEMQKRAAQLEHAMLALQKLEAAQRPNFGTPGGRTPMAVPGMPGTNPAGGSHVDQRLSQVEAKLDKILDELRELRKTRQGPKALLPTPKGPSPMPMPMPRPRPKTGATAPVPPIPPMFTDPVK